MIQIENASFVASVIRDVQDRLSFGSPRRARRMSLFNLRIRGRLYGGFGALVLFGLGMAGFAVWKLSEIRDDVSAMNAQSANAMRSVEISAELQALRRAMLRY